MVKLKVKKLSEDAIVPSYAHDGDAGMDIYANEDKFVAPGKRAFVSTGIGLEFPKGYVALVWDKSGLAAKNGIHCMAGVGDSSYRGEYRIVLLNTSDQGYEIKKGEKIAQILIQPIEVVEVEEVEELSDDSSRGKGSFGSTGLGN